MTIYRMIAEINQACYRGRDVAYFDGQLIQCPSVVLTVTTEADTTETIANNYVVKPDWHDVSLFCLQYSR